MILGTEIGHLLLMPFGLLSAARRAAQTLVGNMHTQPQLNRVDLFTTHIDGWLEEKLREKIVYWGLLSGIASGLGSWDS